MKVAYGKRFLSTSQFSFPSNVLLFDRRKLQLSRTRLMRTRNQAAGVAWTVSNAASLVVLVWENLAVVPVAVGKKNRIQLTRFSLWVAKRRITRHLERALEFSASVVSAAERSLTARVWWKRNVQAWQVRKNRETFKTVIQVQYFKHLICIPNRNCCSRLCNFLFCCSCCKKKKEESRRTSMLSKKQSLATTIQAPEVSMEL